MEYDNFGYPSDREWGREWSMGVGGNGMGAPRVIPAQFQCALWLLFVGWWRAEWRTERLFKMLQELSSGIGSQMRRWALLWRQEMPGDFIINLLLFFIMPNGSAYIIIYNE